MNEVYEETFDVGAVVVLVGHDHDWAIPEFIDVSVDFAHVYSHNFDQVLELLVLKDLASWGISDIHRLTF